MKRHARSLYRAEGGAPPSTAPPSTSRMSSKRVRDPCEEGAARGTCCKREGCERAARMPYWNLLQDDAVPSTYQGVGDGSGRLQETVVVVPPEKHRAHTHGHTYQVEMSAREDAHDETGCNIHQTMTASAIKVTTNVISNLTNQGEK
jgi:hypothetical protein